MRDYSIIVEIIQTRAYHVRAKDSAEAQDLVRGEFDMMQYDVLEETVESCEVEDING